MEFDFIKLLLLLLGTIIILMPFLYSSKKLFRKLIFLFSTISILGYSGIGQSFYDVHNVYMLYYFIFLFVFLFSIWTTFFLFRKIKLNKFNREFLSDHLKSNSKLYMILTMLFFSSLIMFLLIPEFRLFQLLNPPSSNIVEIFERRNAINNNQFLSFSSTINTLLLPFFFMYITYLILFKEKKVLAVILVVFWAYLDFLKVGYLGRYELVIYILFIFFIIFFIRKGRFYLPKLTVIILSVITVTLLPFLQYYRTYRRGLEIQNYNFFNSILDLIVAETSYPMYFGAINKFDFNISSIDFLLWIVFLPLPSAIWPNKPIISINEVFSEVVLGISSSARDFNIILPSLLGESFIIWEKPVFFLHALILGVIIASVFIIYEQSRIFTVQAVYFVLMLLIIGRGGSASYIAILINATVPIMLWLIIFTLINKKKNF